MIQHNENPNKLLFQKTIRLLGLIQGEKPILATEGQRTTSLNYF